MFRHERQQCRLLVIWICRSLTVCCLFVCVFGFPNPVAFIRTRTDRIKQQLIVGNACCSRPPAPARQSNDANCFSLSVWIYAHAHASAQRGTKHKVNASRTLKTCPFRTRIIAAAVGRRFPWKEWTQTAYIPNISVTMINYNKLGRHVGRGKRVEGEEVQNMLLCSRGNTFYIPHVVVCFIRRDARSSKLNDCTATDIIYLCCIAYVVLFKHNAIYSDYNFITCFENSSKSRN